MTAKSHIEKTLCKSVVSTVITVALGISFAFADNITFQSGEFTPFEDSQPTTLKREKIYLNDANNNDNKISILPTTSTPIEQLQSIDNAFSSTQPEQKQKDSEIAISKEDVFRDINNAFSAPVTMDFFAPIEETRRGIPTTTNNFKQPKEKTELQEISVPEIQPEINAAVDSDTTYYASVDPEQNMNLEGRTINSVEISGLKTVNPELVRSQISTQIGSKFSSATLQEDLQKIFATGYFTDIMAVEPSLRYDGSIDLVFTLQENILVSDVVIEGNKVIPTAELNQFINPLKGMPQNLGEINKAIEGINEYYHSKGYILETVASVDDSADGKLSFKISEGIINKINFVGNEKTKTFVIERNTMVKAGDVYNEENLKKDLVKIYATQIFDDVNREIKPSENNDGTYDVNVIVKEKSTNSVSIGGGLDSGLGIFGSVGIRENNFLGRAQQVSLSGIIGSGVLLSDASIKNRINYQVALDFFEPYFLNADTSLAGKLYFRELGSYQVPLAIERRYGLNAIIDHKLKDYENWSTTFATGVEKISLKEGDEAGIAKLYAERGLDIKDRAKELNGGFFLNIAPGVRYSKLDNNELPREGVIAQARFTEAFCLDHSERTNGRLSGMVSRYFPVFKKSSLSLTAKGGLKIHGNEMPEVMAFRLGGPYTVRGFRVNGVGTGNSFIMGSAELLTPVPLVDKLKYDIFKKMRFAFFLDAGKVFQPTIASKLYDRPLGAISIGVGIRIPIPGVGPLSIDYGLPLTNVGAYGSKSGYFTFGTGFMEGY